MGKMRIMAASVSFLLLGAAGCATLNRPEPLPPVNLKTPGWTVLQGQAVWHLAHNQREIAGDVLAAYRADGSGFVQFSKAPFTLVIGQETPKQWQVEFPPQNRHYSGKGQPPQRLIWLYLPRVLAGKVPPENWIWRQDTNGWRLENAAAQESLEGYFNQ